VLKDLLRAPSGPSQFIIPHTPPSRRRSRNLPLVTSGTTEVSHPCRKTVCSCYAELPNQQLVIPHSGGEMSGKKTALAALSIIIGVVLCVPASAQSDEKNSITGMFGRVIISDQGIHGPDAPSINPFVRSGKGASFQVNFARVLLATPVYSVSGEVPAVFNLDEDLGSGGPVVPQDYRQILVTPAVRVNLFPETAVSPWVSFGGGFGHFSENKNLLYYGTNPGGSSNTGVIQGGIGLDVSPFEHRFRRLSFRGEGRDFWSGTPNLPLADTGKTRQHNYFVGAGAIWHF
jgi:hypothetical protein